MEVIFNLRVIVEGIRPHRKDLAAAGFDTSSIQDFRLAGMPVASPAILGTAYAPDRDVPEVAAG